MTVDLSIDNITALTEYVEDTLAENDVSIGTMMKMNIALDEVYSNIVQYSGGSYATVTCTVRDGVATLQFEDDGVPYNPLQKEDADITLSAEEREIGGLGILMVKKTMDHVEYAYKNNKNILILTKKC